MPVPSGESNLYFARDVKVYLKQGTSIWEIPVLDGYSFSQSTNTSEITLSEMTGPSGLNRRGMAVFTDSFAPAEWNFTMYVRPSLVDGLMRAVEEPLWANFVAVNQFTPKNPLADPGDPDEFDTWAKGVDIKTTGLEFDFDDSNTTLLGEFDLYFVLGGNTSPTANYVDNGDTTIYEIKDCVVNEAALTFEVDGISQIGWSGFGGSVREIAAFDATSAIRYGIVQTNNYIRSRLTQLAAISNVSGSSKTYDITLTGGAITLSNNISYLIPETLGIVNAPLGHITGNRSVSGNFTCYLDEATNGSGDLFEDISLALEEVRNVFDLNFYIGGKDGANDAPLAPGMQIKMEQAHLSLPTHTIEDVISFDVEFTALSSNISSTDEVKLIKYVGVAA